MKKFLLYIVTLAFTTWNIKAQEDIAPVNTGAVNFLNITPDARSAGMGGAGVALSENNNAIFYNASTSVISSQKGGISYTFAPLMREYESGHSLNSLGGFYKLDRKNVILGGFRYYHYPKLEIINNGENISESIRPKEWVVDLGYAREIIPNLAASVTIKLIHSDMGNLGGAKSANAVAFDLGAIYQRSFRFLNGASWAAGFQVSNLGSKIKYLNTKESLPAFAKVGGSVDLSFTSIHRLVVAADLGYSLLPSDLNAFGFYSGAEYIWMDHFKVRGGYHYGDKKKGDSSYATAGAGIRCFGAQVDFSWLFANKENTLRNSYWISLGYSF